MRNQEDMQKKVGHVCEAMAEEGPRGEMARSVGERSR